MRAGRGKGIVAPALAALSLTLAAAPAPAEAGSIQPPPVSSKADAYDSAVRRIETHDASGLTALRILAESGYAPAQYYLANLYENGDAGLPKDPVLAREWTERAAVGGDRKAMHNLGLMYFYGEGGPKDFAIAAQWFRKAADLGLVDSQYNLGRLYETGFGVSADLAEAHRWYLIAARSGDTGAAEAAARVGALLNAGEGAPQAVAVPASGSSAAFIICARALDKLGYYQGSADGVMTPALKLSLAAWQRDQGLPVTGDLDAESLLRLARTAGLTS